MQALAWMRILHFAGFTLWISGLVALAALLQAGARSKLPGILADIGATLVIVSGIYNAVTLSLFTQPWLHIKLTLVAVLIGLHVALRVKTRKQSAAGATRLLVGVLLAVGVILYFIVMKPLAR